MNLELIRQSIAASARADFSRSGGPGGQNVNKVNTKVTLRLALDSLQGLSEAELAQVKKMLHSRIGGLTDSGSDFKGQDAGSGRKPRNAELIITSSEERSQKANLERAWVRMEALIIAAAKLPKKRRPTKPSKAAREKRLAAKRLHSQKKAERRQFDFT
jgi:ribosome-associated protein